MSDKGQGLGGVLLLAAVTGLASVADSALLILIPLCAMLAALPPRRVAGLILGIAGAVLLLRSSGELTVLGAFSRGWSLILAGWFLVACVAFPRPNFLPRGLAAVAASTGTAALFFALNPGSFSDLDRRVRALFEDVTQALISGRSAPPPEAAVRMLERGTALQAMLYPAALAIASLAALAVAWWLHRRLVAREARALSRLREFRFADGLIWILIAGVILLVVPISDVAERAGSNLLLFMGALYALRGLAVVAVLADSLGPFATGALLVISTMVYPLTIVVGLTDTWLDLRTRRAAPPPRS